MKSIISINKQEYGNLVVFGDSLGAGANNNNYSFVDILNESGKFKSVSKHCVSGSTIGPYTTDVSISNLCLINQIENYITNIQTADIIMLEYGYNDIQCLKNSKIQTGTIYDTADKTTLCGYTKKALNRIKEINPNATIIWISLNFDNFEFIKEKMNVELACYSLIFESTVLRIASTYLSSIITPINGMIDEYISSDNTHPNTDGHKYIANQILNNLFTPHKFNKLSCNIFCSITNNNPTLEIGFKLMTDLLMADIDVTVLMNFGNGYISMKPGQIDEYSIVFTMFTTFNGETLTILSAILKSDDSIIVNILDNYKHNYLYNSNFINPINQAGLTHYQVDTWQPTIDMWTSGNKAADFTITDNGINLNGSLCQAMPINGNIIQAYTFAACINNTIYTTYGSTKANTTEWNQMGHVQTSCGAISFGQQADNVIIFTIDNDSTGTVQWAACYEGEYNILSLPKYVPKDYTIELVECKRHLCIFNKDIGLGYSYADGKSIVIYPRKDISQMKNPVFYYNGSISVIINNVYKQLSIKNTTVNDGYIEFELNTAIDNNCIIMAYVEGDNSYASVSSNN